VHSWVRFVTKLISTLEYLVPILFVLSTLFTMSDVMADCRGCCSHHGGVTCRSGVTMCRDGTPLSTKCEMKECSKCSFIELVPTPKPKVKALRGNQRLQSFNKAKKILLRQIYRGEGQTFYCNVIFKGKRLLPSTNYTPRKVNIRSQRLEWEHVVPAHAFGQSFKEWREGHPDCVSKGKLFKGQRKSRERQHREHYNRIPLNSNAQYNQQGANKFNYGGKS